MPGQRARPPAAAGTFYPSDPAVLAEEVDRLLDGAAAPGDGTPPPVALIVPHAGYVYSGPVAATAYAALLPHRGIFRRVAILGPAHFVPLRGTAVPASDAWATPLGRMPIDEGLRDVALDRRSARDDGPFAPEHSLEVQLPFLQRVLAADLTVLPVAVGVAPPEPVADLVAALRSLPGTLVIVSTDLSHYHAEAAAKRLDRRTAEAVRARDAAAIGDEDACGVFALRGIVEHARRARLEVSLLDLRTSADTAGDPSAVVGYGAFTLVLGAGG